MITGLTGKSCDFLQKEARKNLIVHKNVKQAARSCKSESSKRNFTLRTDSTIMTQPKLASRNFSLEDVFDQFGVNFTVLLWEN